jgi:hypothetical protein
MLGLIISSVGLLIAYGILPFAWHWQAREQRIAANTEKLARLRGLVQHESDLQNIVRERSSALAGRDQRMLTARTPALAASHLQAVLQEFANRSRVTVSQLDVTGVPDSASASLPMIPANISAIGDIYGVTDMLSLIQHGAMLFQIRELRVRPNPALKGNLLQMTLSLRAPYLDVP